MSGMSFRWAQLLTEASFQHAGSDFVRRRPIANRDAPELEKWRAALLELDRRMRRFIDATTPACGFRWIETDDLSRHICVWHSGKTYSFSFEPRSDGLVDTIVATMHTATFVSTQIVSQVKSAQVDDGLEPAEVLELLDEIFRGWVGALPSETWWFALHESLAPMVAAYGPLSPVGHAALKLRGTMDPSGSTVAKRSGFSHAAFAPLIKLALAFPLPEDTAFRIAFRNLWDAVVHTVRADGQASAHEYEGGLL